MANTNLTLKNLGIDMNSANMLSQVAKYMSTLSKDKKILGSEAYRGLKKTLDAAKKMGNNISQAVKDTIVQSVTSISGAIAAQKGAQSAADASVARAKSSYAQEQLNSLLSTMYNQNQDGQGQSGSTTDINNKGGSGSAAGG